MEVEFNPETEAKLHRAAEESGSGSAEHVRQLVEQYLDDDSWFRQKVNRGLNNWTLGTTSLGRSGSELQSYSPSDLD
jgi:hypothetical protein